MLIWLSDNLITLLVCETLAANLSLAVLFLGIRGSTRRAQARHDQLRDEVVRMLGIHQNILASHANLLRGVGAPAPPIPTMDQMIEAWGNDPAVKMWRPNP